MSTESATEQPGLSRAEYLLDLPPTVWKDVLVLDHAAWLDVCEMQVLRRAGTFAERYGPNLPREAWLGLYSAASSLRETAPAPLEVLHVLFRRAERMGEWTSLRQTADGDEIAAAFAAGHFVRDLIERLPEEVKEEMAALHSAQEEVELRDAERGMVAAMVEAAQSSTGDGPNEDMDNQPGGRSCTPRAPEELTARLREAEQRERDARQRREEARAWAIQELARAEARLERALSRGLAGAEQELQDLKRAAGAFGVGWGQGPGSPASRRQIEGLEQLAALLRRSEAVRKLLDLMGWAEKLVAAERRRSRHGRESFTHYSTQELALEHLAPAELVGLLDPDPGGVLHLDFLRRALDDELLHRQYEGPTEVGRGPFVCLLDKSTSMRGMANATASALELALLQLAVREGRRFVSIPFSGPGNFDIYDPGPRPDPMGLMKHVERTCGGGTEPYQPLAAALELIQEDPSLEEGDVLIVTDGQFGSPPQEFLDLLMRARDEPGLKIVAVVAGESAGEAGFADRVVLLADLYRDRHQLAKGLEVLL